MIEGIAYIGEGAGGGGCTYSGGNEHTYHFVEETVAAEMQGEQVVGKGERRFRERTREEVRRKGHRFVAATRTEAAEVVFAAEEREGGTEGGEIERAWAEPSATCRVGGQNTTAEDVVFIDFGDGGEACVKRRCNRLHMCDAHTRGQVGIQSGEPSVRTHPAAYRDIGVKALGEGVDTRIGASCCMDTQG